MIHIGQEHTEIIKRLATNEGWALLNMWIEESLVMELDRALAAQDSHKAAKHLGAIAGFRSVKDWPKRMLAVLTNPIALPNIDKEVDNLEE